MNLGSFQDLLSSIAKISGLHFEIRDRSRVCFSSGQNASQNLVSKTAQDLSGRAISSGAFQHLSAGGKYSLFAFPLNDGGRTVASLIAFESNFREETLRRKTSHIEDMEKFLGSLAEVLKTSWESQKEVEEITQELTQSLEDIYLYSTIAARIKTLRFSSSLLKDLIEQFLSTLRVDIAFSVLLDRKDYNVFTCREGLHHRILSPKAFFRALIASIPLETSSLEEGYFLVEDSRNNPGFSKLHPDPFRALLVKIGHDQQFYGWLGLVSFDLEEVFRRSELRLMGSIAEQLAVVIANTDLYHDLEEFIINVVKSLVYAIEAKDAYTRGHSERVSGFSMLIAERLELDDSQKESIRWASILHDVGKIAIPEAILNKKQSLTEEEYAIIKSHPEKGYHILRPIDQLSNSLPGILHHHERYDGRGYPRGLQGKNIPLEARIIAIADTFDAITSERAYRPARPAKEALMVLEESAGTQLDPDLVPLLKQILIAEEGLIDQEKQISALA